MAVHLTHSNGSGTEQSAKCESGWAGKEGGKGEGHSKEILPVCHCGL